MINRFWPTTCVLTGIAAGANAQTCPPHWSGDLGNASLDAGVHALLVVNEPGGPALYAGGAFTHAGGIGANRVARFDGTSWSALGKGIPPPTHGLFGCCAKVHSFAVFDDATGPALHIGGDFIVAGGVQAESIAKWQGGAYSLLGSGLVGVTPCSECPPRVYDMEVFDDGSGPSLFVAGTIGQAPPVTVHHIARWDGMVWHDVGGGVVSTQPGEPTPSWISSLHTFDDGSGQKLYGAGQFTLAGGVAADSIARWNGSGWESVGAGLGPNGPKPPFAYGNAMAVFDGGLGDSLYVGGEFASAGGVGARNIARWDGQTWNEVGGGVDGQIRCMLVFDDGTGPALYVGGDFIEAGGVPAAHIARWDGTEWHALETGLDGSPYAMASDGQALYVGGWFTTAGALVTPYLAKWVRCTPCYADCDGSGSLSITDFICFQTRFALGDPYTDCDANGVRNINDFICFQTKFAVGCP